MIVPGDFPMAASKLEMLKELERKVLWLSAWTIHNANHLRENRDGLKVGGHQASCASAATIMTALYFAVLGAEDRVAVKPHAGPVFHAIQYLLGRQTRRGWRSSGAMAGLNPTPRAPRIAMASIFRRAPSASASRRRSFHPWCRITSGRKTGAPKRRKGG